MTTNFSCAPRHAWAHLSIGLSALVLAASAMAQANPYARGPNPTALSLESTTGPFGTSSAKIASPSGYGSGTVYYPTTPGSYGLIAISPGFVEGQSTNSWWGTRLASHGFVVITIGTITPFDQPESRGKQLIAALKQVTTLSQTSGAPYSGRVDPNRHAVMGHSMGGGGTLGAARDNPTLKAAIPLAPWHTTKNFTGVKVPTMVISCEDDFIAPIDTHAVKFYTSLPATTSKAYLELAGANHFCTNTSNSAEQKSVEGKLSVAWMKRFVDNDTRYTPFLSGVPINATVSEYSTGGSF